MQLKYNNYVAFSHVHGVAVNNSGLLCITKNIVLLNYSFKVISLIILCTSSDRISILIFSSPPSTSGLPHLRLSVCSDTQQSLYQHSPIRVPLTDHFSFYVNSPTNDFITRSVEYLLNPATYCNVFLSSILDKSIL